MTNAEARFNKSLRPWKPEGSLGRTAQDVHLDSHTAPELCCVVRLVEFLVYILACQVKATVGDSVFSCYVRVTSFGGYLALFVCRFFSLVAAFQKLELQTSQNSISLVF